MPYDCRGCMGGTWGCMGGAWGSMQVVGMLLPAVRDLDALVTAALICTHARADDVAAPM
jgi:hypothetical protein